MERMATAASSNKWPLLSAIIIQQYIQANEYRARISRYSQHSRCKFKSAICSEIFIRWLISCFTLSLSLSEPVSDSIVSLFSLHFFFQFQLLTFEDGPSFQFQSAFNANIKALFAQNGLLSARSLFQFPFLPFSFSPSLFVCFNFNKHLRNWGMCWLFSNSSETIKFYFLLITCKFYRPACRSVTMLLFHQSTREESSKFVYN